jgi:Zn-dependent protease
MLEILRDDPLTFVLLAIALIEAIALHEFAHAFAADLQGDRMPRAFGRLTLNPVKHLDPLGTLMIFLVGFGWGKPVEFRPQALSSKRFGAAIVALAGPMMNLLLALVSVFIAVPLIRAGHDGVFVRFLDAFFALNVILAVFNLLPLPPLDGSRLLTIFLPPKRQNIIFFLDRYGFIILLGLVFFGGLGFMSGIIDWMSDWMISLVPF